MAKIHESKKVVYVIGPFRAANDYTRMQNIRCAEELTMQLWKMGYAAICPHTNTRHMEGFVPIKNILESDIAIMMRCDFCITTLPFNHVDLVNSEGSQIEIKYAQTHNLPVYESLAMMKLYE